MPDAIFRIWFYNSDSICACANLHLQLIASKLQRCHTTQWLAAQVLVFAPAAVNTVSWRHSFVPEDREAEMRSLISGHKSPLQFSLKSTGPFNGYWIGSYFVLRMCMFIFLCISIFLWKMLAITVWTEIYLVKAICTRKGKNHRGKAKTGFHWYCKI